METLFITSVPTDWETRLVPLAQVRPFPDQPRKHFDAAALEELAASIRIDGLQQPITVRWAPETPEQPYEIIMGERRYRASILAGTDTIRVTVRVGIDRKTHLSLALLENMQRRDLNAIEEAHGFYNLIEAGLKQVELAERVGRSEPYISNALRLRQLPPAVQDMITLGEISAGHGRWLVRFAAFPEQCIEIAKYIIQQKLPVATVERDTISGGHHLVELKLARSIEWNTPFKSECENCPHKAFFGRPNYGFCFLPEEFDAKMAAAKAEAERLAAAALSKAADATNKLKEKIAQFSEEPDRDSNEIPETGRKVVAITMKNGDPPVVVDAKLASKLPRIDKLAYNQYEKISTYNLPPAGCSEQCKCRVIAIDRDEGGVPICMDPSRWKSLKMAETRQQNKSRKARTDEMWQQLVGKIATDPAIHNRLIAVVAYHALDNYSVTNGVRARTTKQFTHNQVLADFLESIRKNYDKASREILANSDPVETIKLAALTMVAIEIEQAVDQKSDRFPLLNFLLDGGEFSCEKKEENHA